MTASNLSADLIHEILTQSLDFGALFAAIRISKAFYEVFKAHPRCILRAVTGNVTGPAMAPAVRLAHYKRQLDGDQPDEIPSSSANVNQLPDEEDYLGVDWTVTRGISGRLEEHAKAIKFLRDFFSLRHKDRKSSTSILGPDEALRFDRAMYRTWLYFEMFEHDAFAQESDDEDEEHEDDDDDDDENRRELQYLAELKKLMSTLSSNELFEILNCAQFIEQTSTWQAKGMPTASGGFSVFLPTVNPMALGRNFELGYLAINSPYLRQWSPFRKMIEDILVSRNIKHEELEGKIATAVVKTVVGAHDACSRCYAVAGLELFSIPNMSLLTGVFPVTQRAALLPGLLHQNYTETRALIRHIADAMLAGRFSEADLFCELVNIVPDDDAVADPEQWSKDDWYCLDCIRDLYRRRLMVWWRNAKAKSGGAGQDDCWYGYNCRTMVHRSVHADKLNHLCTPTRGDAPTAPGQPVQTVPPPIVAVDNPN